MSRARCIGVVDIQNTRVVYVVRSAEKEGISRKCKDQSLDDKVYPPLAQGLFKLIKVHVTIGIIRP